MLQAIIGALVGVGLFLILADALRVPFLATSTAAGNLAKRQKQKTGTLEIWLHDLAMWISKRLRLNEYKRMQHHYKSIVIPPYGSKKLVIYGKHLAVEVILDQFLI